MEVRLYLNVVYRVLDDAANPTYNVIVHGVLVVIQRTILTEINRNAGNVVLRQTNVHVHVIAISHEDSTLIGKGIALCLHADGFVVEHCHIDNLYQLMP